MVTKFNIVGLLYNSVAIAIIFKGTSSKIHLFPASNCYVIPKQWAAK